MLSHKYLHSQHLDQRSLVHLFHPDRLQLQQNILHSHPNSHWSGVLYVQQPTEVEGFSGMIEFVNPNQEGRELAKLLPKSGFDNMIRIRPKTGQIVIFPSYVLHSVYPNSSNQDRITIAFNSLLLKKKKS